MNDGSRIPDEARELFGAGMRMGYVATARPDGHLAVAPVAVFLHEGKVRISSPTDTFKIRNLKHDPHIAVCIPDPDDPKRYLMIRGTAEVAGDRGKEFLNWLARAHMGLETYPEPPEVARTVITIRPEKFLIGGTHGG
jgi:PPOX class probable F420-dependent enzyme